MYQSAFTKICERVVLFVLAMACRSFTRRSFIQSVTNKFYLHSLVQMFCMLVLGFNCADRDVLHQIPGIFPFET